MEKSNNQGDKENEKENHHSPNRKTIPQPREANILIDPTDSRARALTRFASRVEFRDHDVGRVRDDCAEDAGQVAGGESHPRLRGGRVVGLLPWQALVHHLDDRLEGGELHHRVGDLAAPEGVDSFVEAGWGLLELDYLKRDLLSR